MAKYKIIPSSRTIVQSPISIGHKAEKGVEAIEFDLTAWVETYGSGTLTVIMRRWGDAIPYPIALEIDENNKAVWTLSGIDTAKAGMAYAQLSYIVGDEVVKKSDIYTFRVMDSLTGEGEPPEAYESWLEHLTHLAAEAMAEVLDIEGIVTDKTLTVDGGIADGKATGDALALKADKATTYTKSEVDNLIESVDVETDTTLSVSGKPADAKTVGDELSEINESLQEYENIFTGNVGDSVSNWLGEHPEATTTVQDGSITDAKLTDALKLKVINNCVTPQMFGAKGDGETDDSVAIQNALNSGFVVFIPNRTYVCNSLITKENKNNIFIFGCGEITTNNAVLFSFTNCNNVNISGIRFTCTYNTSETENVSETTQDPNGFTSLSPLINFDSCNSIRMDSVKVTGGYTGIYAKYSTEVYLKYSEVSQQRHICVCCSTSQFNISNNKIHGITNPYTEQYANYLIQATDDSTLAKQEYSVIDNNVLYDNPNWDAIMSHIYKDFIITNNHIYNVRSGIDVSPLSNIASQTFVFRNLIIANNNINGTDTDVDNSYSHINNGITFATNSQNVYNVVITGNVIRNFCKFFAPSYGAINVVNAHNIVISENIIENNSPRLTTYGTCVEIRGTCDTVVVTNNTFDCPGSGILFNGGNVTVSDFVVRGNAIKGTVRPATFLSIQDDSTITNLDFDNLVPQASNNVRCPAGSTVNGVTFSSLVSSLYYSNKQAMRFVFTYSDSIAANASVTFNQTMPFSIRNTDIFLCNTSNRFVSAFAGYGASTTLSITLTNHSNDPTSGTITINVVRMTY